jgi:hypothetical protein
MSLARDVGKPTRSLSDGRNETLAGWHVFLKRKPLPQDTR